MARTAAPRNSAELITESQSALEDAQQKLDMAADRLRKALKKNKLAQKAMVAEAVKPA